MNNSSATDYSILLEDYIQSIENLPGEIQQILAEIHRKDVDVYSIRKNISDRDTILRDLIRHAPPDETTTIPDPTNIKALDLISDNPEQKDTFEFIQQQFKKAEEITDQKISIAEKSRSLVDKHIKRLIQELDKIVESNTLSMNTQMLDGFMDSNEISTPVSQRASPTPFESQPDDEVVRMKRKASSKGNSSIVRSRSTRRRKSYSNSSPTPATGEESTDEVDESLYCTCRQVSFGEMIACDNPECPYEWFHIDCVGLSELPTGSWYCKDCRRSKRFRG